MRAQVVQKYKNRTIAKKIFRERKEEEAADMKEDPLEEMFRTTTT